jgi:hypothetical protein
MQSLDLLRGSGKRRVRKIHMIRGTWFQFNYWRRHLGKRPFCHPNLVCRTGIEWNISGGYYSTLLLYNFILVSVPTFAASVCIPLIYAVFSHVTCERYPQSHSSHPQPFQNGAVPPVIRMPSSLPHIILIWFIVLQFLIVFYVLSHTQSRNTDIADLL